MHLLADNLDQHPLSPPPVKFTIKDPLPGAKIELAVRHRDHHLASYHLSFGVGVGVPVTSFRTGVLTAAVVLVLADRCMRRQRQPQEGLQPVGPRCSSAAPVSRPLKRLVGHLL